MSTAVLWGLPDGAPLGGPAIRITEGTIPHCWQQKRFYSQSTFWKDLWVDDSWTFFGITVTRMPRNSMGLRWSAEIPGYRLVRADTKDGIREIIRHYRSKGN